MSSSVSTFRPRDALLLGILALVWGNSFLFIKIAVAQVPPPWLVALRMALGAAVLIPIALWSKRRGPRDVGMLATLALIGTFGAALPWTGQAWAQQFLDSGLVAVLNATTPLATLALAVTLRQEQLYANRIVGLSCAVTGTLVVIGGEIHGGRSVAALAMAVLSTAGYAIATVMTRARVSGRVSNVWAAALQLTSGALVLGPVAYAIEGPVPLALRPGVALAVLALGVLGTGMAFLIFFTLIERVGATNTSMVTYLVPIVGLTSGALLRAERFGANVFFGAMMMIGGIWLAQRTPRSLREVMVGTLPPKADG